MTTIRLKFSTQDLKVRSWWNRMQSQSTGLFYFHCYILGSLLHHTGDAYTSKEQASSVWASTTKHHRSDVL